MKTVRAKAKITAFIAMPVSACLLSFPQSASAAEGWTTTAQVLDFGPRELGVDIYMPAASNPMTCSFAGWYSLKATAQNYDMIASFVLTQFAQRAPIRFYVNGCDSDGASIIVAARAS